MQLKFKIIWTRIYLLLDYWNVINFSETPCTSQMISNFMKHFLLYQMIVGVCVCVCVCERERDRDR